MSTIAMRLPDDHPMMASWLTYKSTPDFANAMSWLNHEDHRDGSMWRAFSAGYAAAAFNFQDLIDSWMLVCFTVEIANDLVERNDRFMEESLELVQALDYTAERAHALVDYVFGRPRGEARLEVGGVMVTLAALCTPNHIDMVDAAQIEYRRINTPEMIEKIRAKQAGKPTGSALPTRVDDSDYTKPLGQFDRWLFAEKDTVKTDLSMLSGILYRICGGDQDKFEEVTDLIKKAYWAGALTK